jgi:hypothetical protein
MSACDFKNLTSMTADPQHERRWLIQAVLALDQFSGPLSHDPKEPR